MSRVKNEVKICQITFQSKNRLPLNDDKKWPEEVLLQPENFAPLPGAQKLISVVRGGGGGRRQSTEVAFALLT